MIATAPLRTASARPLLEVAPDLFCLPLPIVNVYFAGSPDAGDRQWVLVDAGLPGSAKRIREAAEQCFGSRARPAAIVLTHGHFDHVGALRQLAEQWDAPVYAHQLELPYLTGRSSYPPPDPTVGGGGMAYLSFLYPRGPIQLGQRVHPLPEDGTVPGMAGWRWIHTPGHTPGHVSLFREADGVLIAGDAFVTTQQESLWAALNQPQHVCRPPAYYTPDWSAARESVRTLARLRPSLAATGHGKPMSGPTPHEQLDELAERFDQVAIPHRGRYVHQSARTDEQGVTFVPPAATQQQAFGLIGAAAIVGIGLGLLTAQRRRHARPERFAMATRR